MPVSLSSQRTAPGTLDLVPENLPERSASSGLHTYIISILNFRTRPRQKPVAAKASPHSHTMFSTSTQMSKDACFFLPSIPAICLLIFLSLRRPKILVGTSPMLHVDECFSPSLQVLLRNFLSFLTIPTLHFHILLLLTSLFARCSQACSFICQASTTPSCRSALSTELAPGLSCFLLTSATGPSSFSKTNIERVRNYVK